MHEPRCRGASEGPPFAEEKGHNVSIRQSTFSRKTMDLSGQAHEPEGPFGCQYQRPVRPSRRYRYASSLQEYGYCRGEPVTVVSVTVRIVSGARYVPPRNPPVSAGKKTASPVVTTSRTLPTGRCETGSRSSRDR